MNSGGFSPSSLTFIFLRTCQSDGRELRKPNRGLSCSQPSRGGRRQCHGAGKDGTRLATHREQHVTLPVILLPSLFTLSAPFFDSDGISDPLCLSYLQPNLWWALSGFTSFQGHPNDDTSLGLPPRATELCHVLAFLLQFQCSKRLCAPPSPPSTGSLSFLLEVSQSTVSLTHSKQPPLSLNSGISDSISEKCPFQQFTR